MFGFNPTNSKTSFALEKLFHAAWWDYSDFPLNLHGRICLFASLGFGVGGLLTVYVIAPFTVNAVSYIQPIVLEFLALLFLFVFAVDLTLTVTILLHFDLLVAQIDDSFIGTPEAIWLENHCHEFGFILRYPQGKQDNILRICQT